MPTFLSRRPSVRLAVPAVGVLAVAITCASAQRPTCQAFEAKKTIQGGTSTFTLDKSPWKVTSESDSTLVIANTETKTSCTTSLESVLTAYFGRDVIYLRSTEIASDQLFTVNGRSCKETAKPKPLDGRSCEVHGLLVPTAGHRCKSALVEKSGGIGINRHRKAGCNEHGHSSRTQSASIW